MLNEAEIRDQLAKQLAILEDGLVFLAKEHPLPNAVGSKGYIDILAKDRFGNRVIIEVKRSNTTARQALHEILKYTALFVANEGLSLSKLRCFVVSTEWHELLVPFSEFLKVADIQAEGFKLRLNGDSIDGADRVEAAQLPEPISLFREHGAYFFQKAAERDENLLTIQTALDDSGADSHLVIALDYKGPSAAVIFPYCAYFVPISIRGDVEARLNIQVAEEVGGEAEVDRIRFFEESFNELVADRTRAVYDKCGRRVTFEIGYPEKFVATRDAGWECLRILRRGRVGTAALEDAEILSMVGGVEGQSVLHYCRVSSPRFKLAWAETLANSERCLKGNDTWQKGFEWFCSWIDRTCPSATFSAQIYNPLKLPHGLYKLVAQGDGRYLPSMELVAAREQEGHCDTLLGTLLWDGTTIPSEFGSAMVVLCGGLETYLLQSHFGTAWQMDSGLLALHGLRYGMFHLHVEKNRCLVEEVLSTADGITTRAYDASTCRTIDDFVAAAEEYCTSVVSEMDRLHYGL